MNLLANLHRFWLTGSGRRPRRGRAGHSVGARLRLEALEDRLVLSNGTGADTILVNDINTSTMPSDSDPRERATIGGTVFFSADDGVHGRELWKSDGTEAGTLLVRDINPGSGSSNPVQLTNVNGTLIFATSAGLWRSDGTAAGTILVSSIRPLFAGTNVNGTLFFSADDGNSGQELWKSDGTAAGTVRVANIAAGGASSYPSHLTKVNGTLFFSADDGKSGLELWKSDGTAAGTVRIANIASGKASSNPHYLTNVSGTLFFAASDGPNGEELWKSDGTTAGTVLIKDINPGGAGSSVGDPTEVNGRLYFTAWDGTNGEELWKSDGTAAGTVLVKDIKPGSATSVPLHLTNVNGTLFLSADDGTSGVELWKSDGTTAGTVRVKDIYSGSASSDPRRLTNVNGTLFFGAGGVLSHELWKSDGTAAGTVLVKDVDFGNVGSYDYQNLTSLNGTVFFTATDGTHGWEPWKSDGTAAGTVLVKDISASKTATSYPMSLTDVNGMLFFSADNGTNGRELWKSDGTAAGTVLVKDLNPGSATSDLRHLTNVNGTLFFTTNDGPNGVELWKSDGTAAGTVLVKDIRPGSDSSYPDLLTNVNGTLFFTAFDGTNGAELWKSDGTAAGTLLVRDINAGGGGSVSANLTNVNGTLFFTADDGTSGVELWKSNGTTASTVRVKDINLGSGHSSPSNLTNVNGTLFFTADDGTSGVEPWKSDGTAAGTVRVKDINPGSNSSRGANLTNVNGTLFFTADDGTNSVELWKSDGTTAGTVLVKDLYPGTTTQRFKYCPGYYSRPRDCYWVKTTTINSSNPRELTNVNGTLFFLAYDGTASGLWKSDGTSAGTVFINDIDADYLTNASGTLYFWASDGTNGAEPWKSDGTVAGTVLVADINPGSASSNPFFLTVSGGHLFFTADDGVHGRELWDPPVSSSIAGTVVEDQTGNGISTDDSTIQGRTIHLFRDNGDGAFKSDSDTFIGDQTTGKDGSYVFRQLSAGTYFVQQELPLGWVQTVPNEIRTDVIIRPADCGQTPRERNDTLVTAVATGLGSPNSSTYGACGEIGDNNHRVLDVDLFRIQASAGEVIRADVDAEAFGSTLDATLRLFDAAGVPVMANTDVGDSSDPYFEFTVNATGTYYVGVSGAFNADYNPTVEGSGNMAFSTGAYTLQIDVSRRPEARPLAVTLASGEARTGVDLASSRLGSIGGRIFEDLDGDGSHDGNEPGLDGWKVTLRHDGGLFSATVSRSIDLNQDGKIDPVTESGIYSFQQLSPGDYFINTLIANGAGPVGWTQVSPRLDSSTQPCIGVVSRGLDSDAGIGLRPDLTVDLVHGLCDRFQVGNALYFGQATPNIGLGPMELRAGADLGNGTQIVNQRIYMDSSLTTYTDREAGTFTFHPEHNHIHFNDYATYTLRQALADTNGDGIPEVGSVVAGGQKTSFCLIDVSPYDLTLPNAAQADSGFGCDTAQRISVGWEDIYDPLTVGQQIDVRGLNAGQYWLEAIVDPDNRLLESNENNNTGRALVSIGLGGPDAPFGSHSVQLSSGQVVTDKDFANFRTISISGRVFNDKNANGKQDNKEHGLDGFIAFIDSNGDGVLNNPEGDGHATPLAKEPWAITDNQGNYVFAGRGPGPYRIRLVPQPGWTQTTPNPAAFSARSGQDISGLKFGVTQAMALMAEEIGSGTNEVLTRDQLTPLVIEALGRWQSAGFDTPSRRRINIRIADLWGSAVGASAGHTIWLDSSAAGWGWFVDSTPANDSEFTTPGNHGEQGRMDLLSAIAHEVGHILGHAHSEASVMADTLRSGIRVMPAVQDTRTGPALVDSILDRDWTARHHRRHHDDVLESLK
jgi:ELWxxDGT repeat protein